MHLAVKLSPLPFFKNNLAFLHGENSEINAHAAVIARKKIGSLLADDNSA